MALLLVLYPGELHFGWTSFPGRCSLAFGLTTNDENGQVELARRS